MSDARQEQREEGFDYQALALAAIGSAIAALVTSQLWPPGAVYSAALTPLIIALVKEGLRKPAQRVTAVGARAASAAPAIATLPGRRSGERTATAVQDPPGDTAANGRPDAGDERAGGDAAPGAAEGPTDPAGPSGSTVEDRPYEQVYSSGARRRPRLKLALITGLLAFLIAAFAVTVPELLFGGSVGGGDGGTTLFDSDRGASSSTEDTGSGGEAPESQPAPESGEQPAPAEPQQQAAPDQGEAPPDDSESVTPQQAPPVDPSQ